VRGGQKRTYFRPTKQLPVMLHSVAGDSGPECMQYYDMIYGMSYDDALIACQLVTVLSMYRSIPLRPIYHDVYGLPAFYIQ